MSIRVLFAWIGNTDIQASNGKAIGIGPIAQVAVDRSFDEIHLLSDHKKAVATAFRKWLAKQIDSTVEVHQRTLSGPTEFGEIFEAAVSVIERVSGGRQCQLSYHVSPGTPAMGAVWILLAKTSHPATLIDSSLEKGVRTLSLPFEIAAEYIPTRAAVDEEDIVRLTQDLPPEVPEFGVILHRSKVMERIKAKARRVADFDVPVLIQGESGTGKELFARAIRTSSPRAEGPFIEVNCGAIPGTLVESQLFGHKKGAFTGATTDHVGFIQAAHGGTLFLDEIGELPKLTQVTLLRVLQERTVQRLGDSKVVPVDFRLIAATNRTLVDEVDAGRFRDDLFHRIAIGVINLPPLRERTGDIGLLAQYRLDQINEDRVGRKGWVAKTLSAGAKNLLNRHSWPGNIRELFNTVSRAAIWATGETIQADDIRDSLFPVSSRAADEDSILNRDFGAAFDLEAVISEVATHYLKRALNETRTKEAARKLLGFGNATTLTNWLRRYGVEQ
ncbi:Nif-specific regulatory protein [Maioricimonas rarisocia]|uniref:Nif-specific regulatory protein n=1 Tax=Maioricimonas rarisocia TaxID=2528026 RepID=A0A517Z5B4_9PLAN|nr:sigma-54 dependent transcriptional regulator [Maioricimonas rarisocia]QDU37649.1 Nif-specific regulatory protein [Maioricimonas rarisocia]